MSVTPPVVIRSDAVTPPSRGGRRHAVAVGAAATRRCPAPVDREAPPQPTTLSCRPSSARTAIRRRTALGRSTSPDIPLERAADRGQAPPPLSGAAASAAGHAPAPTGACSSASGPRHRRRIAPAPATVPAASAPAAATAPVRAATPPPARARTPPPAASIPPPAAARAERRRPARRRRVGSSITGVPQARHRSGSGAAVVVVGLLLLPAVVAAGWWAFNSVRGALQKGTTATDTTSPSTVKDADPAIQKPAESAVATTDQANRPRSDAGRDADGDGEPGAARRHRAASTRTPRRRLRETAGERGAGAGRGRDSGGGRESDAADAADQPDAWANQANANQANANQGDATGRTSRRVTRGT